MSSERKLQFVAPYHDSLGLSVYNCGSQKCDPGFSWGPALRNHHLIHFVAKGKGRFQCDGKEYVVRAGSGFYAPADKVVFYAADKDDPWEYLWVGFNGVDAVRLLKSVGLTAEDPCFTCSDPQPVIKRIKAIYNANGASMANETEMIGQLYRFFSLLLAQSEPTQRNMSRQSQYLETAVRFIERNYSLPITVNAIAKSAAISRSQLYRVFMQELGITPNDYLTRYRIGIACHLLGNKSVTIGEAAYSCGFSDPQYFSRVFKKLKHMTPKQYASGKS